MIRNNFYNKNNWDFKFPINQYKFVSFSMCVFGARRSGKSYFIEWLLKKRLQNRFDQIIVFCPTIRTYKYINPKYVYSSYKPDIIKKIIKINETYDEKSNILIIFDDMIGNNHKYNNSILKLYALGRHHCISIIYTAQSYSNTATTWRENSDFVILFRPSNARVTNYLVENIMCGTLKKYFDKHKEEYKFYSDVLNKITEEQYRMVIIRPFLHQLFSFKVK